MSNIIKVTEALTEWGMNVAKSVLPNVQIPPMSGIGSLMNMIGVDPRTYNIYDELGFIVKPMIRHYVEPMLNKFFDGKSDEEIKEMAMMFANSFAEQASERNYVNLFGIQIGRGAFEDLKDILTEKLR